MLCVTVLHRMTAQKIFLPLRTRNKYINFHISLKPNAWSEEQQEIHFFRLRVKFHGLLYKPARTHPSRVENNQTLAFQHE